jgi:hypothetical protein
MVSATVYPDDTSPDIVAIWWIPVSLPKTLSVFSETRERFCPLVE